MGVLMRLLLKWLAVTAVIFFSPQVTSSISVGSFSSALWAAFVYGVLFVLIGWLIRFVVTVLAIVPGILTLGLFFLLVPLIANAALLKLTAGLLGAFEVRTWSAAFGLSLVISVIGFLFEPKKENA
jgi:putative membrane protein